MQSYCRRNATRRGNANSSSQPRRKGNSQRSSEPSSSCGRVAGVLEGAPLRFRSINSFSDSQAAGVGTSRRANPKSVHSLALENSLAISEENLLDSLENVDSDNSDSEEYEIPFKRPRYNEETFVPSTEFQVDDVNIADFNNADLDPEATQPPSWSEHFTAATQVTSNELVADIGARNEDVWHEPGPGRTVVDEPQPPENLENVDNHSASNNGHMKSAQGATAEEGNELEAILNGCINDADLLEACHCSRVQPPKHPELIDDGIQLLSAGEYTVPPPSSRYKGLLMTSDGIPEYVGDFRRVLLAFVHRCFPDTTVKWRSAATLEGKRTLLRDMEATFGSGMSRVFILRKAREIVDSRRNNLRRAARQGKPRPANLSEEQWTMLLQRQPARNSCSRREVSKLGSGGWASVVNTCVKRWGFVPSSKLKEKAKIFSASALIRTLEKMKLPLRDPSKTDADIWREHRERTAKTVT